LGWDELGSAELSAVLIAVDGTLRAVDAPPMLAGSSVSTCGEMPVVYNAHRLENSRKGARFFVEPSFTTT